MKLKSRKTTTSVTTVDEYALPNDFVLTVTSVDGQRISQNLAKGTQEYYYFQRVDEFKAKARVTPFWEQEIGSKDGSWFYQYIDSKPFETISLYGFSVKNCILIENSSHNFRDWQNEYLPSCIIMDYIKGFTEKSKYKNYAWEPLKKYLKKHKNVISVEEMTIPSYNADFYGQKGLTVKLTILPEWRLVGKYAWDAEAGIFSDADPLGIAKFKISDETEEQER